MTSNERIRIGILGCSDIARRRFLPALAAADNARLTAIASRDPGRAKGFLPGAAYEACGYDDLLAGRDVDLVYVSLPNHLHEEWTVRALERGKHVICEKPLGLDAASVERMSALAERKGLALFENIMYLHHPQHAVARDLAASGRIGTVRELRAAFGFRMTAADGFRLRPHEGGGAFYDLARYPLSATLFFLEGAVRSFKGYALVREGIDVSLAASGVTDRDGRVSFTIGFDRHYECWYELVGDRGKIRIDRAFTTPADLANDVLCSTGAGTERIPVSPADHFKLMIERVCGSILRGGDLGAFSRDARRLALLADLLRAGCERIPAREKETPR